MLLDKYVALFYDITFILQLCSLYAQIFNILNFTFVAKTNIMQCPALTNVYLDLNIKNCAAQGAPWTGGPMPWHNWHTS